MNPRVIIPILIAAFAWSASSGQTDTLDKHDFDWNDTTYKPIVLQHRLADKKIIKYDYGKQAFIYLNYGSFRELCTKRSQGDWMVKEYKDLSLRMDSLARLSDTLYVDDYNSELEYITSALLKKGEALVFDKKSRQFTDTIYHRLEKYGAEAHRFFYFHDKRAFFSVMELSGILEKGDQVEALKQHYADYLKLYDRLRETGK